MRRLIINADDFGFTAGVNRGIVEAHEHGVVTSTTLMANGAAFRQATELAKQFPKLSIGCHVVLIQESPVLRPEKVPSLTRSGRFRGGLKTFAAHALAGRFDSAEITAEATAQIRKLRAAGLTVSHLETTSTLIYFQKS